MTFASFLIVPLIAGFMFANRWFVSKFRIGRSNGYALYFSAATHGAALLLLATLSVLLLDTICPGITAIVSKLSTALGFNSDSPQLHSRLVTILLLTLFYGLVGGAFMNLFLDRYEAYKRVIADSDFERLVLRAIERSLPMLVTLDNGKVYVGYAIRTIDPMAETKELRILPVFSGFRSPETGEVTFRTNYSRVLMNIRTDDDVDGSKDGDPSLSHLTAGDFEVVIPVSRIVTSTLYDAVASSRFSELRGDLGYKFEVGAT
ncbi:MAG: hypothetical protein NXH96_02650 [Alteromonadaceae bacterium]|nr:hypothetical protein [Alteromonadaceae bacterium]